MKDGMTGVTRYAVTFGALLVLLGGTLSAAFLNLGAAAFPIAMAIACAKALLIGWFFMHLAEGPPLVRLVAIATLLWLLILIGLTMCDFATRPSSAKEGQAGRPSLHFAPRSVQFASRTARPGARATGLDRKSSPLDPAPAPDRNLVRGLRTTALPAATIRSTTCHAPFGKAPSPLAS